MTGGMRITTTHNDTTSTSQGVFNRYLLEPSTEGQVGLHEFNEFGLSYNDTLWTTPQGVKHWLSPNYEWYMIPRGEQ
jgi:hypothetical protein